MANQRPKNRGGRFRPPRVRLPKVSNGGYFFFEDFLLLLPLLFFDEDLEDFFEAISLTTFHAVRDLPVALTWQDLAGFFRQIDSDVGGGVKKGMTTCDID